MSHPIVLAITGASGAAYARRLLELLLANGTEVHLTISPSGRTVLREELAVDVDLDNFRPEQLLPDGAGQGGLGRLIYHHHQDFMAPIASGSFLTSGMVICPCSGSTLSGVAHGGSANLIQRAADVHLKERRRLILVPRETPLSLPQIENLRSAHLAGATILPAAPGWYHGVRRVEDLVDFVVARILDQLAIRCSLIRRWGEESAS
ncbi:MAG: UbiX family flavin prenyltransferase [Planctomycetes bacterium]|nr:UbiX family flavin prenyltransferase [Planctomycetota bacterium]